jgi:transcriptional regulator with XRE-family HTH domain
MTQRELADAAGLTASTVNRIEQGLRTARISTVRKLAAALQVDAAHLYEDEERKS